jgi:hypothetical protein
MASEDELDVGGTLGQFAGGGGATLIAALSAYLAGAKGRRDADAARIRELEAEVRTGAEMVVGTAHATHPRAGSAAPPLPRRRRYAQLAAVRAQMAKVRD